MATEQKISEGILLAMGNPLLDISAAVLPSFLTKYNLKAGNAILCGAEHLPIYGELAAFPNVEYIAGGAAQNTIRVAQWMLQTEKATGYVGCIGRDNFGSKLREMAESDHVTIHYLVDEKTNTGTCACLIVDRERSLVANLGAALKFQPSFLSSPALEPVVARARFFYIEGYFLTSSFESCMYLAQHARQHDKILTFNLSATFICETQQLVDILPYVDLLFGNESEALAFAQKQGWTDTSVETIAPKIASFQKANNKARTVVITQGANATVVFTNQTMKTYPVPPLEPSKIVDSNGAGDAFVGGFLSQLVRGASIDRCIEAGHYASRTILQVSGTILRGKPTFT